MNNHLEEYIKKLSKRDKKNLIQKNLKLFEEAGELAKKVLPYGNAFATTHRFVNKEQILEDIADSMLCLISMIYDPDMDLEMSELEDMMFLKAKKWDQLQLGELELKYPLPYEIHVTIEATDRIEEFKAECKSLNVKPILLDLEVMNDCMTSSIFMGDNGHAIREVQRISEGLKEKGFNVLREKVETIPWHPAAPSKKNNSTMPKDCYFECHFAIKLTEDKLEGLNSLINLSSILRGYKLHKSRNIFKKTQDYIVQMLTYRVYDGVYEDFQERVDFLKSILEENFTVDKTITEFSIYDSKVKHDSKWLGE